jgi:hypothetical protein
VVEHLHDVGFVSTGLQAGFPLGHFYSREHAESECDWMLMSSVFVTSESNCVFLCSRELAYLQVATNLDLATQLRIGSFTGIILQLAKCLKSLDKFVFYRTYKKRGRILVTIW